MTRRTVLALLMGGLAALGIAAGAVLVHTTDAHACPTPVCLPAPVFTAAGPDLFIQSITVANVPGPAQQVKIEVAVRNGGTKAATNFHVLVTECIGVICPLDTLDNVLVPNLPANATQVVTIIVDDPPGMPVDRVLRATADHGNMVAETNESNNYMGQKFTW